MPTNRRTRSRQRKDKRLVLVFERRPISRERWARHREQIMREDAGEGRRPPEWWIYEKDQEPPEEREAAMLLEMGELGKSELARLMKHWREKWEKALKDHGFCCGHKPGSNHGCTLVRRHSGPQGLVSVLGNSGEAGSAMGPRTASI